MNKKQQILKLLKSSGELVLSRIANLTRTNYDYAEMYCGDLVKEGKIQVRIDGNKKYYKLKGGD